MVCSINEVRVGAGQTNILHLTLKALLVEVRALGAFALLHVLPCVDASETFVLTVTGFTFQVEGRAKRTLIEVINEAFFIDALRACVRIVANQTVRKDFTAL